MGLSGDARSAFPTTCLPPLAIRPSDATGEDILAPVSRASPRALLPGRHISASLQSWRRHGAGS